MSARIYFVSGIDTNTGKTIITGRIAKELKEKGFRVTTMKLTQTGCQQLSEDILIHRQIMGEQLNDYDKLNITCPFIFKHPASPHLSAKMENKKIEIIKIEECIENLKPHFDYIIIEGVGGLYVPLTENFFVIDFIKLYNFPLILVTNSKLGSINHTLMSLELCKNRNINLIKLVYNSFPLVDEIIYKDSCEFYKKYLKNIYPDAELIIND